MIRGSCLCGAIQIEITDDHPKFTEGFDSPPLD
jgi:hypothetical protein